MTDHPHYVARQNPSEFVQTAIDEYPLASASVLLLMMAAIGALGFVRIALAP